MSPYKQDAASIAVWGVLLSALLLAAYGWQQLVLFGLQVLFDVTFGGGK